MKKLLIATAALALLPAVASAHDYQRSDSADHHGMWSFLDFGSHRDNTRVDTNLSSNEVANVQQILKNEGFYRLPVDGNWGRDTVSALLQFQRQNDLKATGVVDAKTAEKLNQFGGQYYVRMDRHGDTVVMNEPKVKAH